VKEANLQATPILDYRAAEVQQVLELFGPSTADAREFLRRAHNHVSKTMRAIYSIDETIPVSRLFTLNQGSCSQRMACVEALARARGIATRVCALWLDRTFWYSRLPLLRFFLPKKGILMPWPQFFVDNAWLDFAEIYDSIAHLAARAAHPFTNRGISMFDAVQESPVDFFGKSIPCDLPRFSLADVVISEGGYFDTRDDCLSALEKRSWLGRLIFKLTYENKPVRRLPE
jgi:hypothetical protein